ncbi:MAG: CRISPR-associated endonuclease Cas1 [bacterium]
MNPLLLSRYGISFDVDKAHLTVKQKDKLIEFEPYRIPYDSIIIDGHYGSMSFEVMRFLSKHDVSIGLLNWNGNLLSMTQPREKLNAELKIKQYEKYMNLESRLYITGQVINQKIKSSLNFLNQLSRFYNIDLETINKEVQGFENSRSKTMKKEGKRLEPVSINEIMMLEGRIASAYWNELSKIFNQLAPDFRFETRKNLSYSWNMNESDPVNALLNYRYAILESMVRKGINTMGLYGSIGYLHEIAPSKHPLVNDLQELLRYVVDYSVIELLERGLKKSDFITTENYHIRLKPETTKKLIENITNNFNKRYEFSNKQRRLENIMFENIRELSRYISGKFNELVFKIPDIVISRNDDIKIRNRIMSIDPEKRKDLKINKSTLWYQQKKIKEGKSIKLYNKTRVKVE